VVGAAAALDLATLDLAPACTSPTAS
jgi:hypothetical protein